MRKKRRTKKTFRWKPLAVFLTVLMVGCGIGLMFSPAFRVNEVLCEGNQMLSREEIVAAARVKIGGNLFAQRMSRVRRRVLEVPMVEDARVTRVFPDKIRIAVTERIPAAYVHNDQRLIALDLTGRVIETIEDGRVAQAVSMAAPKKVEAPKEDMPKEAADGQEKQKEDAAAPAPSETPKPTASAAAKQDADTEKTEAKAETEETAADAAAEDSAAADLPYAIPVVEGLELSKAETGKDADSKERDKLSRVMETLRCLQKNDLLARATYLDVTNIHDVTLVIENRLQIQLGSLDRMEYRTTFLAKVIKERIGASEEAVMDYRSDDIYVRQPEDGKARMVRPSATPKPSPAPSDGASEETEGTAQRKPTETASAKPVE